MTGNAPLDGTILALACAIAGIGALVQGIVGFGLALVAAPLLALLDPALVPGPVIFAALGLTLVMSHRERHAIDWQGFHWALLGRLAGTALAAVALAVLPPRGTALVFGLLVLLGVLLCAAGWRLRPDGRTLLGAGALSGFMGTTSSIGGPPLALVYQEAGGARLRATLSGHFVIGSLVSLVALWGVGRFGRPELLAGLALLPGIMLGLALATRLAGRLDARHTRLAVLVVSGVAGLVVTLQALA